jgi:hypothetical protein
MEAGTMTEPESIVWLHPRAITLLARPRCSRRFSDSLGLSRPEADRFHQAYEQSRALERAEVSEGWSLDMPVGNDETARDVLRRRYGDLTPDFAGRNTEYISAKAESRPWLKAAIDADPLVQACYVERDQSAGHDLRRHEGWQGEQGQAERAASFATQLTRRTGVPTCALRMRTVRGAFTAVVRGETPEKVRDVPIEGNTLTSTVGGTRSRFPSDRSAYQSLVAGHRGANRGSADDRPQRGSRVCGRPRGCRTQFRRRDRFSPADLAAHVMRALQLHLWDGCSRDVCPAESPWTARPFLANLVLDALAEHASGRTTQHPKTAYWEAGLGIRLPGRTAAEQLHNAQWAWATRHSERVVHGVLLGAASPSQIEHCLGADRTSEEWPAAVGDSLARTDTDDMVTAALRSLPLSDSPRRTN